MIKKILLIQLVLLSFGFMVYLSSPPIFAQEKEEVVETPAPTPLTPQEAPQTGINLTVSPVFVNLVTDPGETITAEVKIKNNSNIEEFLAPRLLKFETSPDGARPLLVDMDKDDVFAEWVTFSETSFGLLPNETKTIKITIDPPKDAALGYYYGVAFIRVVEGKTEGTGTNVTGAPAVSLLLEVRSPQAKKELQLLDFTTDKLFYEYLPATFTVTMKNTGNIHIVPSGNIFIDWGGQKDIGILQANEARGNVLPNGRRSFTSIWDDGMIVRAPKTDEEGKEITGKDGKTVYETKVDVDKPLRTFRIGKYTAHLLMVYDNGERDVPLEGTVSFWVIPWKLIILAVFVIIGPVILSNIISRQRRKKKL